MIPTESASTHGEADRSQWAIALLHVDEAAVLGLAEALASRYDVRFKRVPKSGLGMMRMRDSVMRQAFNLGEVPMSSAHVEVIPPSGQAAEGAASILRDHEALAIAIAICDAVLSGGLDTTGDAERLVRQGLSAIDQESRVRQAMLDRSRVSFSLMNQESTEGGEGGDD